MGHRLCPLAACSTDMPQQGQAFAFTLSRKPATAKGAAATAEDGAATAAPLFDTRSTNLIFKDQYIELTSAVPQDSVLYGLGETAPHQAPSMQYKATPLPHQHQQHQPNHAFSMHRNMPDPNKEGAQSGNDKAAGPRLSLPRDGRTVTLWNLDAAPTVPGMNVYGERPGMNTALTYCRRYWRAHGGMTRIMHHPRLSLHVHACYDLSLESSLLLA